ncbi:MAG: STAS domain-containing protein [Desulfovibrio sp.]|jgi:anti-anti-sigma factor|nr:STAS domain-containing protein [Desulfovibrio sp.]
MNIHHSVKEHCSVIGLEGRLEAGQADAVLAAVRQALADGPPNLLLDCSQLSYAASMGLRCFLLAQKEAQQAGGTAVFSGLNDNVRSIFTVTGFDKLVRVLETEEEALALFNPPPERRP